MQETKLRKLSEIFKRMNLYTKKPHLVNYFTATSNFGDLINQDIFNHQMGCFKNVSLKDANFLMTGSLLQEVLSEKEEEKLKYKKNGILNVFGSGFIQEKIYEKEFFIRDLKFYGVRGKLSLERIKNMGLDIKNIILGDLGLLVDELYKINKAEPIYDLGIIPHYVDQNLPIIKQIKNQYKNALLIDIKQEPRLFIQNLLKCKTVVSSSLHGLIAADSYQIPNLWMKISDDLIGGEYKFKDYYSVFNLESHKVETHDFNKIDDLAKYIRNNYRIKTKDLNDIKMNLRFEFNQFKSVVKSF